MENCPICYEETEDKFKELKCKHTFHEKCVDKWLSNHNTCPMCRTKVGFNGNRNYMNEFTFLTGNANVGGNINIGSMMGASSGHSGGITLTTGSGNITSTTIGITLTTGARNITSTSVGITLPSNPINITSGNASVSLGQNIIENPPSENKSIDSGIVYKRLVRKKPTSSKSLRDLSPTDLDKLFKSDTDFDFAQRNKKYQLKLSKKLSSVYL